MNGLVSLGLFSEQYLVSGRARLSHAGRFVDGCTVPPPSVCAICTQIRLHLATRAEST